MVISGVFDKESRAFVSLAMAQGQDREKGTPDEFDEADLGIHFPFS